MVNFTNKILILIECKTKCITYLEIETPFLQVVGVADFSDPLIDSNESIVDETDEDSSLQSDNEVVPKNLLVCL